LKYLSWALIGKLELRPKDLSEIEKKFAEYIGVRYCRVFPSARIALYFSLKALNLPPGSKILMPPITIKPMLDIIYSLHLEPIFVDLDKENFAFDLDDLAAKIDSKTKVVFLTYLFGSVPDMERLREIVEQNSLILIEDFSQAIGASFQEVKVGSFGSISIYSASSIKTLDTLGGGFAVTKNLNLDLELMQSQQHLLNPKRAILIKKAISNLARNIGTNKVVFLLITANLLKIIRMRNQVSANRMTGTRSQSPLSVLPTDWFRGYSRVQFRIALEQFKEIDKKLEMRIKNALNILEQFKVKTYYHTKHDVYWQLCILSKQIDNVFKSALDNRIDISQTSLSLISDNRNYPHALPCINAREIYFQSFFVPCYPQLTNKEIAKLRVWLRNIE
jgi:dTDP-4-amino-4,6-dideoxygalactose transaminase